MLLTRPRCPAQLLGHGDAIEQRIAHRTRRTVHSPVSGPEDGNPHHHQATSSSSTPVHCSLLEPSLPSACSRPAFRWICAVTESRFPPALRSMSCSGQTECRQLASCRHCDAPMPRDSDMNLESRAGKCTRVRQAPSRHRVRQNANEAHAAAVVGATRARQAQRAEGLRPRLDHRWSRMAEGRGRGSGEGDRR